MGAKATIAVVFIFGASPAIAQMDQVPLVSETLRGEYAALAECAYDRIDKLGETGVKKTDLPGSKRSKLTLESGGVRYWEISFTAAAKGSTAVEMSVVRTMWGPSEIYIRKIMPEVRRCADR